MVKVEWSKSGNAQADGWAESGKGTDDCSTNTWDCDVNNLHRRPQRPKPLYIGYTLIGLDGGVERGQDR